MHYGQDPDVFTGGPVDAPPAINVGKAGRKYPVHFELYDASGAQLTDVSAVTSITYAEIDCGTFTGTADPIEAESNGSSGLTNHGGEFKFTWSTPNTAGCYVLDIDILDGSVITANFQLT